MRKIWSEIIGVMLLPFVGTVLGAALVLGARRGTGIRGQSAIEGFSAGVMVAASVWSLIIPSMEIAGKRGIPEAIPAAVGFVVGMLFFLGCDRFIVYWGASNERRLPGGTSRETFLPMFAVAVHNLPEGMAVGAICAEVLAGASSDGISAAVALSIGIAVQNLPEGAIVSLPLYSSGVKRWTSFGIGALSGVVEPIGAALTVLAAGIAVPILPYLLGFAAGAMMYAVFTSEREQEGHSSWVISFAAGFVVMMCLDVILG